MVMPKKILLSLELFWFSLTGLSFVAFAYSFLDHQRPMSWVRLVIGLLASVISLAILMKIERECGAASVTTASDIEPGEYLSAVVLEVWDSVVQVAIRCRDGRGNAWYRVYHLPRKAFSKNVFPSRSATLMVVQQGKFKHLHFLD